MRSEEVGARRACKCISQHSPVPGTAVIGSENDNKSTLTSTSADGMNRDYKVEVRMPKSESGEDCGCGNIPAPA